jgi:hypothetical protein
VNNPLTDKQGEISRYTSVKVNMVGVFAIVVTLVSSTWVVSNKLNDMENRVSHIQRTQQEFQDQFNVIAEDKKVTKHDFKRTDALLYCKEIAEVNRVQYPGLKCPDPFRIPTWRP